MPSLLRHDERGHAVDRLAVRLAALIVPVGLGATALAHSALTTHMAVHLCGWPATVSCDFGVPVVWWVLIAGLWTIVAVVTIDALTFIRKPKRDSAWRLLGWAVWGPTLVATTIATMQDRTLHPTSSRGQRLLPPRSCCFRTQRGLDSPSRGRSWQPASVCRS